MPDPLVVQTLSEKRAEILGRIAAYEAQIAQAKHDLAHVNATIRLFTEPQNQQARYLVSHGFFKMTEADGKVFITDLRMGNEPTYTFHFNLGPAAQVAAGAAWSTGAA